MKMATTAILALLLSGCSASSPDPRGVARDEVLLQVSATGRTDTRPDQARFTAGVQTIGANAGEASARNNAAMNNVVAALERLGMKRDDLQTQSIGLSRIDYGPNRGRFEANNLVEVRVRDLRRAGEAIAAATQAGANILSGPNLTLADPEKAGRSAYAAAYRAARARADAYASAAGLKVARVLAIRDAVQPSSLNGFEGMVAAEAPRPNLQAPPIQAGVSTQEVRVQADFALAK
ncbi:MAG: uncharacterized protein QOE79_1627 [Sphingomonadales bacterium]|jgi:uncharacterized protein YggE|nr:uncharacterized protein [Sphingomonadales bacterium]